MLDVSLIDLPIQNITVDLWEKEFWKIEFTPSLSEKGTFVFWKKILVTTVQPDSGRETLKKSSHIWPFLHWKYRRLKLI